MAHAPPSPSSRCPKRRVNRLICFPVSRHEEHAFVETARALYERNISISVWVLDLDIVFLVSWTDGSAGVTSEDRERCKSGRGEGCAFEALLQAEVRGYLEVKSCFCPVYEYLGAA